MSNAATDIDRALASIRGRADHLRYTISRLEHNLAWNPTMTWPELLGQFMVVSKQLENMNLEIPEMIEHFVCIPVRSTPNPADIPLLLRTREDPEMEEKENELIQNKTTEKDWDAMKREIDRHNDFCDAIEDHYKAESEKILKEIKVDKYAVPPMPKATQNSFFKFMETGQYV